jgi:hypothetical protein
MSHAAKRAWPVVSKHRSSPALVVKKPIEHGISLEPGATRFRVHHDQR